MKQPLTAHWCNVLEYVEILWALSDPSPVTGIYLWNPSPYPIPTHLWADPHLAYQWLPALLNLILASCLLLQKRKTLPSLPSALLYSELHPWAQNGLGALGLVSAGCHGLMKAAWPHDHAAVISVYLCIRGASSVYAWLHGCGYSSL